jgi:hypothetical protein
MPRRDDAGTEALAPLRAATRSTEEDGAAVPEPVAIEHTSDGPKGVQLTYMVTVVDAPR